jgi:hypothetical protein
MRDAHLFIGVLIDGEMSNPYNYGRTRPGDAATASQIAPNRPPGAKLPESCLPATVQMENFHGIVLTNPPEGRRRERLAPGGEFSETSTTCR